MHKDYFALTVECSYKANFLVNSVGEKPSWPIQRSSNGRKKKVKGYEQREIRSSLLTLDLKEGYCISKTKSTSAV